MQKPETSRCAQLFPGICLFLGVENSKTSSDQVTFPDDHVILIRSDVWSEGMEDEARNRSVTARFTDPMANRGRVCMHISENYVCTCRVESIPSMQRKTPSGISQDDRAICTTQ